MRLPWPVEGVLRTGMVLLFVGSESAKQGRSHEFLSICGIQKVLFGWIGQEPQLHEDRRHLCEADYVITSLANPAIFSAYPALELILNEASQFQTFVDKNRLLQGKGDVGVRIVWVETAYRVL